MLAEIVMDKRSHFSARVQGESAGGFESAGVLVPLRVQAG
jgi:hypothetical protein